VQYKHFAMGQIRCALGLLPLLAATAASDARRPLRVLAYGSSPLTGLGCDRPDVDACDLGDWTYTVHDGIEQTLGSAAVVDMVSHLHWTARRMCDHFLDRRNAAALFDAGTFVSAESPQLRVGLLLKTRPSTFSWSMDASRSPAPARGDRMAATVSAAPRAPSRLRAAALARQPTEAAAVAYSTSHPCTKRAAFRQHGGTITLLSQL